jgi:hypothetical protein
MQLERLGNTHQATDFPQNPLVESGWIALAYRPASIS